MLFHVLFSFFCMFCNKSVSGSEPAIICCKTPNPALPKRTIRNQCFINTLPLLSLRNYFFFYLHNRDAIVLDQRLWDQPCCKGLRLFSRQKMVGKSEPRRGRDLCGVLLQVSGKTMERAQALELPSRCRSTSCHRGLSLPRHSWYSTCNTCTEGRAARWLHWGDAVISVLSVTRIIYSFRSFSLVSKLHKFEA